MGEAACLLRSFSHPSESSHKAEQGDPIRALGESISFERFVSESLAWEKWSSFSQNRYLEEVEKFSKPGSVAQKKAYFEAHYKKKALEREANFCEETNAESAIVTQAQNKEFVREKADFNGDEDERLEDDISNSKLVSSIHGNVCESPVDRRRSGENSESKEEEEEAVILQPRNTENNDSPIDFSKSPNKILEIVESMSKKRPAISSPKLGAQIGESKLPSFAAKKTTSLRPNLTKNGQPKSKKPTKNVPEKEKLPETTKSLHTSITFLSGLRKSNTTASVTQPKSKVSENGRTRPIDGRTKTLLSHSVSGTIALNRKSKSPMAECSKSSSAGGNKLRSPAVSAPFNFRIEERALKRKQRMEEKAMEEKQREKNEQQTRQKVAKETVRSHDRNKSSFLPTRRSTKSLRSERLTGKNDREASNLV